MILGTKFSWFTGDSQLPRGIILIRIFGLHFVFKEGQTAKTIPYKLICGARKKSRKIMSRCTHPSLHICCLVRKQVNTNVRVKRGMRIWIWSHKFFSFHYIHKQVCCFTAYTNEKENHQNQTQVQLSMLVLQAFFNTFFARMDFVLGKQTAMERGHAIP